MRSIYINSGQKNRSSGGAGWKIFMFLFLFLIVVGSALKLTAPMIVEKWINKKGATARGYAYSIRDVDLSFSKGHLILTDVKVFNPETNTELLEVPNMVIQLSWEDLVLSQEKKVSVSADKVELTISKDFSAELERIKTADNKPKKDIYLDVVEGKIGKLNIIEQKADQSRTVIELNDVDMNVKNVALHSINKKSQFNVSSNIAEGGKLNLSGKTSDEDGKNPWSIQGSLKEVPSEILNKIAGNKLPFAFREPTLNVEISAQSNDGKISGEIAPDIKILNLIDERPGIPTQLIARALSDDLTFSLPFTLKDELTLNYADIFAKLKNYRRYPASSQTEKTVKTGSFWPF